MLDAQFGEQPRLDAERREAWRCRVRRQDLARVGLEGDHAERRALGPGLLARRGDQRAVAAMDAVEIADRDHPVQGRLRQRPVTPVNLHRRLMPAPARRCKARRSMLSCGRRSSGMATRLEELYETDFYVWTQRQAEALRRLAETRPNLDLDFPHLIEEVTDLGASQRDAVRSQLRRIIEHCLKLELSRAADPRGGWRDSILDARAVIGDKLSPSLRRDLDEQLPRLWAQARSKTENALRGHRESGCRRPAAEGLPLRARRPADRRLVPAQPPRPARRPLSRDLRLISDVSHHTICGTPSHCIHQSRRARCATATWSRCSTRSVSRSTTTAAARWSCARRTAASPVRPTCPRSCSTGPTPPATGTAPTATARRLLDPRRGRQRRRAGLEPGADAGDPRRLAEPGPRLPRHAVPPRRPPHDRLLRPGRAERHLHPGDELLQSRVMIRRSPRAAFAPGPWCSGRARPPAARLWTS